MLMKRSLRLPLLRRTVPFLVSGVLMAAAQAGHGQAAAPAPLPVAKADDPALKSPEFEVASIKPYKQSGDGVRVMIRPTPDGFDGEGLSLHLLIRTAYGVEDNQIIGGDKWLDSDLFEIHAKMDQATVDALGKLGPKDAWAQRQKMIQALLADRFKLKLHRETRDLPVYALIVAKGGPKLQEAKDGDTYPNGIKAPNGKSSKGMMRMGPGELTCQAIPMENMASMLSNLTGRHVVDKTGLTGKYDLTLKWSPGQGDMPMFKEASSAPNADEPGGISIYTALQEQLGLKLEAQKAPVEVLVIDHAEKPTVD